MIVLVLALEFSIKENQFWLNGESFQVVGAEITPSRHHFTEWRDRIRKARFAGFNTIALNVIWRAYERENGFFDFISDQNNLNKFVKLCHEERMYVVVRAGPFIHSGANLGGWPHWLLAEGTTGRFNDEGVYKKAYSSFLKELTSSLLNETIVTGGPILMFQLDDEYAKWPVQDSKYLTDLQDIVSSRFQSVFFTADDPLDVEKITWLSNSAVGLDLRCYNQSAFSMAEQLFKDTVIFASRLIVGEDAFWESNPVKPDCKALQATLSNFLENKRSFILTPFAEGTNFGSLAGSLIVDGKFKVYTTRQGVYAPITQSGDSGSCFTEIKNVLSKVGSNGTDVFLEPLPKQQIMPFQLTKIAGIKDQVYNVGPHANEPIGLQWLDLEAGFAIYETILAPGPETTLQCEYPQDYSLVYLGKVYLGSFDRQNPSPKDVGTLKPLKIAIPAISEPTVLQIFVYALGHAEYYDGQPNDQKGLFGTVFLGDKPHQKWSLTWSHLSTIVANTVISDNMPEWHGGVFQGVFEGEENKSTFFDLQNYKRGFAALNGHVLGNYQNTGALYRLYCPGAWINKGKNTLLVVDVEQQKELQVTGFELPEGCPEGQKLQDGFCQ